MTTTPPNLRDLFGDRFRVGHDPAAARVDVSLNGTNQESYRANNGSIHPI